MTQQTDDQKISVDIILSRLEKHRDETFKAYEKTPKWRWKRRQRLLGAYGAYLYEIERLLEITSAAQSFWKSFVGSSPNPLN